MNLIDATRQENALTANGAITNSTTLNNCLDLFFVIGSSHNMSEDEILKMFKKAEIEDQDTAWRIAFWSRDCRGGAGHKRAFRIISKYYAQNHPDLWAKLSIITNEYGSWKDFFLTEEITDDTLNFLDIQLEESPNANLLAKWYPRKGKWFSAMHKFLKCSPKDFRKRLVNKTDVVETKICSNDWGNIEFSKVPSVAMNRYRTLFYLNDYSRFDKYIKDVLEGKQKINSSVLYPHTLVNEMLNVARDEGNAIQAQWENLPNFMEGSKERIIPVCDVSGSMMGLPMAVSIGLGLYISERNEGIFKDAFITFSESPEMQYVKGNTLMERVEFVHSSDWGFNTNLIAVFNLILSRAVKYNLPKDQMPTKILIISDMEFDEAASITPYSNINNLYNAHDYELPEIIFWNVNGRIGNNPVNESTLKAGLVSGFSPSILKHILKGEVASPTQLMMEILYSPRYDNISKSLNL